MTSEPLQLPFIGITMYKDDYSKVKGLLPTPSYTDTLQGYNYTKIILIYAIEGYITSHNQYRWISNIKLGLKKYLCVPFEYEEDYRITGDTNITTAVYTIKELSKAFKSPLIIYPKALYPSTKKELYKCLCRYGTRLIHQECFTKEAMTSIALLMNSKLKDQISSRELHRKVLGACMWIDENREGFSVRLDEMQLKDAHTKGGLKRKDQRVKETKERVQRFLTTGDYTKPNGRVNLTKLSKAMNMTRKTVAKYIEY